VPPLRQRRQDIPDLCRQLLLQLEGGAEVELADTELARLQAYDWPGNVRELRNILERSLILFDGAPLQPSALLTLHPVSGERSLGTGGPSGPISTLLEIEEAHIRHVLGHFGGNVTGRRRRWVSRSPP